MDFTQLMSWLGGIPGMPPGLGGGASGAGLPLPPSSGVPNPGVGGFPDTTITGMPNPDLSQAPIPLPPQTPLPLKTGPLDNIPWAGGGRMTLPMGGSGVPYSQATNLPGSLGAALEGPNQSGAPMVGPPVMGAGSGPTSPGTANGAGYYGGSPETNPNLKPISGSAPTGTNPQTPDVLKALGAIKAPAPPQIVQPGSHAPPTPLKLGGNNLQQLLMSLLAGQGRGIRMPTTLGQALELKPSGWGLGGIM